MDSLTLILGFAIIAGLAIGYLTARFASRPAFRALVILCVIVAGGSVGAHLFNADIVTLFWATVAALPFAISALVASGVGLFVRRIV